MIDKSTMDYNEFMLEQNTTDDITEYIEDLITTERIPLNSVKVILENLIDYCQESLKSLD